MTKDSGTSRGFHRNKIFHQSLNTTTILKAEGTSFINEKVQRDLLLLVSESPASRQSPALASTLPCLPGCVPFTPAMPPRMRSLTPARPFPHVPPRSAASPSTVSLCFQSLPHSPLPAFIQVLVPPSPYVSLSLPSSTPKDLTMPKAAGHSTRARCGFSREFEFQGSTHKALAGLAPPCFPREPPSPGGKFRDTHHIPLH